MSELLNLTTLRKHFFASFCSTDTFDSFYSGNSEEIRTLLHNFGLPKLARYFGNIEERNNNLVIDEITQEKYDSLPKEVRYIFARYWSLIQETSYSREFGVVEDPNFSSLTLVEKLALLKKFRLPILEPDIVSSLVNNDSNMPSYIFRDLAVYSLTLTHFPVCNHVKYFFESIHKIIVRQLSNEE